MANTTQIELGSVVSLWRYPVKSMMGEELNAVEVTDRGLLGDRAYALRDPSNGKVVSAKHPRKWAKLFDFRAAFAESPRAGEKIPPVRITLPNGGRTEPLLTKRELLLVGLLTLGFISLIIARIAS